MNDSVERQARRDYLVQQLEEGRFDNVKLLFETLEDYDELLPELAMDLNLRVRSGVYRLLLELEEDFAPRLARLGPALARRLAAEEPTLRGDLCSALGLVGTPEQVLDLEPLLDDPNQQVRELAAEAIEEIAERYHL